MPRTKPNFLKLHVEDTAVAPSGTSWPSLDALQRAFAESTGWTLTVARELAPKTTGARRLADVPTRGPGARPQSPTSLRAVARTVRAMDNRTAGDGASKNQRGRATPGTLAAGLLRLDGASSLIGKADSARVGDEPPLSRSAAETLVAGLNGVLSEWLEARDAIREREAELATALPIIPQPDETEQLVARLNDFLKLAADSLQAPASAVYLLDDSTSCLKLRASHGLPPERFFAPPRPLRGQLADLEALLGRPVVIGDMQTTKAWNPPEPCRAAVCVPILTPAMPLGTLWVFAEHVRAFTPSQIDTMEIIAGRLASEFERESLLRENTLVREVRTHWRAGLEWQRSRQPQPDRLAEGWEIAGWTPQTDRLSGQFIDWEMTPQGTLAITLARSEGRATEAALSAASLHGILKSRLLTARDPRQLLNTINDTAWRSSAGDGLGSLAHAAILPERGTLQFSGTGDIGALWLRADTAVDLPIEPAKLGQSPEVSFPLNRQTLAVGDMLVLCAAPLVDSTAESRSAGPATARSALHAVAAELAGDRVAPQRDRRAARKPQFPLSKQALVEACRGYRQTGLNGLVEGLRQRILDSINMDVEPPAFTIIARRSGPDATDAPTTP